MGYPGQGAERQGRKAGWSGKEGQGTIYTCENYKFIYLDCLKTRPFVISKSSVLLKTETFVFSEILHHTCFLPSWQAAFSFFHDVSTMLTIRHRCFPTWVCGHCLPGPPQGHLLTGKTPPPPYGPHQRSVHDALFIHVLISFGKVL